jgi:hypothetical protein
VPDNCLPVQCPLCEDWLACPPALTAADRRQVVEEHRHLCPAYQATKR